MKLLVFGGTFDPPHLGHMDLLRNAIACVRPNAVAVVPAGIPPHKPDAEAKAAFRLAMCACFEPLFPALVVSDVELRRAGKSYTLDTVRTLRAQWPGCEVYLSIGGDMLLSFQHWHRFEELLREVTLVVQHRQSDPEALAAAAEALRALGGRVLFAQGDTTPVSSTQIREGLERGEDRWWAFVPPPADALARANHLYDPANNIE